MTAVARLLERKSLLLELLEQNPGPEEREQIERLLAQVNTVLIFFVVSLMPKRFEGGISIKYKNCIRNVSA
jgi:hypothetical protein